MNTLPTKQEKTMKQIALKSKIILSTIIVLLCAQAVSAKDGISAGLEFGGVGSENNNIKANRRIQKLHFPMGFRTWCKILS